MASSSTEISNLALSHLGIGKEIADLETESSQEASACRRFYEITVGMVLEEFSWAFAKKTTTLSLIAEDPTTEWEYSYRYPTDCSLALRILSGTRNETRQTRIPYKIVYDATGRLIYTNEQDAVLEYIKNVEDTGQFKFTFTMVVSLLLAFYIAPRLTGGDPFKLGERAHKKYEVLSNTAKARSLNEQQDEEEPESEFIRERL